MKSRAQMTDGCGDSIVSWIAALESAGHQPATIRSYRLPVRRLSAFLYARRLRVEDCEPGLLAAFLAHEETRYQPRTVRLAVSALRRFGDWAVDQKLWRRNFACDLTGPPDTMTPTHTLSEEESLRLLRSGPDPSQPGYDRDVLLVRLAVECGLKTGEIERLTWADVDVERGHVCVQGGPRRGTRYLELGRETLSAFRRVRGALDTGPVFAGRDGVRPVGARRLLVHLKRMGHRAGLSHVNFDALRFAAVRGRVKAGGPLAGTAHDLGFAHPSGPLRAAGRFGKE